MRTDPEGSFEPVIDAFRLGEAELAASYFSEDCDYAVYIPSEPAPYGGSLVGRLAVLARFQRVFQEFDILVYEARAVNASGDEVRSQLKYAIRHRETGEELEGVGRIEVTFANGKIIRWHAFHDGDRIHAYLKLCRSRSALAQDLSAAAKSTVER